MENKQTAIDWLNLEVERLCNHVGVNMSWAIWEDLIKQAKEIENEKIINSNKNIDAIANIMKLKQNEIENVIKRININLK
jgi:hypothetical protein